MLTPSHIQTPTFIAATGVRLRGDYVAMIALLLFCAACLLIGAGGVLRLAFPAASLAVGAFLFWRHPVTYLGFVWWMWFLTSWLSRLVDYQSGWDAQRLLNVAPFLVTGITIITLWRNVRLLARPLYFPFLLVFAALLYGLGVGLLQNSPVSVVVPLLKWLTPVLFGFHLAVNWQHYEAHRHITQRAFLWGVLLMGGYGVAQFLFAPAWDQFWLVQTEVKSFGSPEPLGIRVWSTMNSPGTFSMYLMAGLVLLFSGKGALRLGAVIPGYLALLLTLARTAWSAWFVSLVLFMVPLERRAKLRILVVTLLLGGIVLPFTLNTPLAELLSARVSTFSNLKDDDSLNERQSIYEHGLATISDNIIGEGIGRAMPEDFTDSAVLDLVLTLGWFGAALYLLALAWMLVQVSRSIRRTDDTFLTAARAISVSISCTLLITSQMLDVTGVLYWAFLAFPLSAACHQRSNLGDV